MKNLLSTVTKKEDSLHNVKNSHTSLKTRENTHHQKEVRSKVNTYTSYNHQYSIDFSSCQEESKINTKETLLNLEKLDTPQLENNLSKLTPAELIESQESLQIESSQLESQEINKDLKVESTQLESQEIAEPNIETSQLLDQILKRLGINDSKTEKNTINLCLDLSRKEKIELIKSAKKRSEKLSKKSDQNITNKGFSNKGNKNELVDFDINSDPLTINEDDSITLKEDTNKKEITTQIFDYDHELNDLFLQSRKFSEHLTGSQFENEVDIFRQNNHNVLKDDLKKLIKEFNDSGVSLDVFNDNVRFYQGDRAVRIAIERKETPQKQDLLYFNDYSYGLWMCEGSDQVKLINQNSYKTDYNKGFYLSKDDLPSVGFIKDFTRQDYDKLRNLIPELPKYDPKFPKFRFSDPREVYNYFKDLGVLHKIPLKNIGKYQCLKNSENALFFPILSDYRYNLFCQNLGIDPDFSLNNREKYYYLLKNNADLGIAEGNKKALSCLSRGLLTVRVNSITTWFLSKKIKERENLDVNELILIEDLKRLLEVSSQGKIFLLLDSGDFTKNSEKSKKSILYAIKNFSENLLKYRSDDNVKIGWWCDSSSAKGIDDLFFSGVNLDDFLFKFLISVDDFKERIFTPYINNKNLTEYRESRIFTPDHTINDQFCGNNELLKEKYRDERLVALKAVKGCGKTVITVKHLKALLNKYPNLKVIIPLHRKKLLKAVCDEFYNYGVFIIDQNVSISDVEAKIEDARVIGICIDSLHKIENIDFTNYIVFIDEVSQVLRALKVAKTEIKNNRIFKYEILERMLRECSQLIASDADLSDADCEFLAEMSQSNPCKVENIYKQKATDLYNFKDRKSLNSTLFKSTKKGSTILFVTDNATEGSAKHAYYTSIGVKCVLLTKDSIDKEPRLVTRYLTPDENGIIGTNFKKDDIQLVIISPALSSGISINIKGYFDCVFGDFYGIISPNDARQMLLRLRDLCDRYIYYEKTGKNPNYCLIDKSKIERSEELKQALLVANEFVFYDNMSPEDALELMLNSLKKNKHFRDLIAHEIFLQNIEKINYGTILHEGLIDEGYNIIDIDDEAEDPTKKDIKAIKEEIKLSKATLIKEVELISELKASLLERKTRLTEEEEAQLEKYRFNQLLPNYDPSIPFIMACLKDKSKIYARYNLIYSLYPEFAKIQDANKINYELSQIKNARGEINPYDLSFRSEKCKLGQVILNAFKEDRTITELKDIAKQLQYKHNPVKNTLDRLGLFFSLKDNKTIITSLNKLLNVYGKKLKKIDNQGIISYRMVDKAFFKDRSESSVNEFFKDLDQCILDKISAIELKTYDSDNNNNYNNNIMFNIPKNNDIPIDNNKNKDMAKTISIPTNNEKINDTAKPINIPIDTKNKPKFINIINLSKQYDPSENLPNVRQQSLMFLNRFNEIINTKELPDLEKFLKEVSNNYSLELAELANEILADLKIESTLDLDCHLIPF